MRILLSLTFLFFSFAGFANPHWDEKTVPKDNLLQANAFSNWRTIVDPYQRPKNSGKALRITVAWNAQSESYQIAQKIIENSGTESLILRSKKVSPFGSYRGTVTNEKTNTSFHDSIGTGRAFRKLVRDITFRFPLPESDFVFRMTAEHPVKGHQENVLEEKIKISQNYILPELFQNNGFQKDDIVFHDDNIKYIIQQYCKDEEGVRNIKRCLEDMIMKLNLLV
jgi:hypothetical protein